MNRKMIGWIALAVVIVGGLFYGMTAALGSEPAPKADRVTRVATKPASSTEAKPNALETAKDVFDAISNQGDDNAEGSGSPLGFLKDLGKTEDK